MNGTNKSVFTNLEGNLPPYYDFTPEAKTLVLEIKTSSAPAAEVRVEGRRLIIGRKGTIKTLALLDMTGKTIGDVEDDVNALISGGTLSGFTVTLHAWHDESALRLMETDSTGDTEGNLYAAADATWAVLKAIALELDDVKTAQVECLRQMSVPGAVGTVQDYWGGFFGVTREDSEGNAEYGHRVVSEVSWPKSNNRSLERIIKLICNLDASVYELSYEAPTDCMLMNTVGTPIYNVSYPLWTYAGSLTITAAFVVRLEGYDEGDLSADEVAQLQEVVYRYKVAGIQPFVAYDDNTVAL